MPNPIHSSLSVSEYMATLQKKNLDHSEYLILTLGFLETVAEKGIVQEEMIEKLQQAYFDTRYEEAFAIINEFIETHKDHLVEIYGMDILNGMKNKSSEEVNPENNLIRGFYETKLAEIYIASIKKSDFNMNGINNVYKFFKLKEIIFDHLVKELSEFLNAFNGRDLEERYAYLQDNSLMFEDMRDRGYKNGFERNHKNYNPSLTIYSANTGVMKSTQSNFYDETSEKPLINKVIDKSKIIKIGYFNKHKREVFAGSISGHAYYIAAVLEKYLKKNAPYYAAMNLEQDINYFIKACVASYIYQGFHGLGEIMDVFRDPIIKDIFYQYDVKIDFSWPQKILEEATKKTQEYARVTLLKEVMHQEIKERSNKAATAEHSSSFPKRMLLSYEQTSPANQTNKDLSKAESENKPTPSKPSGIAPKS